MILHYNDTVENTLIDTLYSAAYDTRPEVRVHFRMPDGNIHTVPYQEAQCHVLPYWEHDQYDIYRTIRYNDQKDHLTEGFSYPY